MHDSFPAATLDLASPLFAIARRVAECFRTGGFELFLVGGVVRDGLLDRPIGADLDFATNAPPDETRRLLASLRARPYDLGARFGTIGGTLAGLRIEITTYRAETYQPGSRKPEVAFHGSLPDDLARRDFTINAIAFDPLLEELHDPFGGCADLTRGVIRAVGAAGERFREDPLRLLRALRFAARLDFEIDPPTAASLAEAAASLATISRERVRDELDRLLLSPFPALSVDRIATSGFLPFTVPDLDAMRGMRQETGRFKDVYTHTLQVLDRTPPTLALRWAALLHDVAKPRTLRVLANGEVHFLNHDLEGERMSRRILADLRQPAELIERVSRLVGLHLRANAYDSSWTDGAVRRFVREVGDDLLPDLLALSRADVTSGNVKRRTAIARSVGELEQRIGALREQEDIARLQSPLDGNDLMRMFNRSPGPWIRPIKDHLTDLVVEGQLAPDDRETAERIAQQLFQETNRPD